MLLSIGYCPVKFNFRMENNLVQESAIDQSLPELIEGDYNIWNCHTQIIKYVFFM